MDLEEPARALLVWVSSTTPYASEPGLGAGRRMKGLVQARTFARGCVSVQSGNNGRRIRTDFAD